MSWEGFLSQAGCVFFSNSRNSKRSATFHSREHESMQLHTCEETSASNISLFMHSWCLGGWHPGLAILLCPFIGLLDDSNPKKWTQCTNKDSTKKCHNPRPCHIWTRGLYTCPFSIILREVHGQVAKWQNSTGYKFKRHQTSLKSQSEIGKAKSTFNFSIIQSRHCTAGIAGIPCWSENGCMGSSATKLPPCLARSSWWLQCSPADAGIELITTSRNKAKIESFSPSLLCNKQIRVGEMPWMISSSLKFNGCIYMHVNKLLIGELLECVVPGWGWPSMHLSLASPPPPASKVDAPLHKSCSIPCSGAVLFFE